MSVATLHRQLSKVKYSLELTFCRNLRLRDALARLLLHPLVQAIDELGVSAKMLPDGVLSEFVEVVGLDVQSGRYSDEQVDRDGFLSGRDPREVGVLDAEFGGEAPFRPAAVVEELFDCWPEWIAAVARPGHTASIGTASVGKATTCVLEC